MRPRADFVSILNGHLGQFLVIFDHLWSYLIMNFDKKNSENFGKKSFNIFVASPGLEKMRRGSMSLACACLSPCSG